MPTLLSYKFSPKFLPTAANPPANPDPTALNFHSPFLRYSSPATTPVSSEKSSFKSYLKSSSFVSASYAQIVEMSNRRMLVADTDIGCELRKQIEDLKELLKTNAIYQEVFHSQTGGAGDFDEGGEPA